MQRKWQFANFQCENCMVYFQLYEYVTLNQLAMIRRFTELQGGETLCGQVTL